MIHLMSHAQYTWSSLLYVDFSGPSRSGIGGLVLLLKCEIYSKPCLLHPGFADTRVIKLPPLTSLLLRRSLFLGLLPARKIEHNTTPPKGLMLIRTTLIRRRGGQRWLSNNGNEALKKILQLLVLRSATLFDCNSTFTFKAVLLVES